MLGTKATIPLLFVAAEAYKCSNFFTPVVVTAPSFEITFPPFQNHYDSVAYLVNVTARAGSPKPPYVGAATNVTRTFSIGTSYCVPDEDAKHNGVVQVLTHGLGFDRSYWDFGGPNSSYNYIKAATEAGYATLSYDRIGNGMSTIPDPYTIVQGPIELGVLEGLTVQLRNGTLNAAVPKPTGKVVHVGHSYGSVLTNGLIGSKPSLSDGAVLTGYSLNSTYKPIQIANTGLNLARENAPARFGNYSTGYLTWPNELANQYGFFHWPDFSPAVLAFDEATKQPFTVGEMLTAGPPFTPAESKQFANPVLILSGHFDTIFCGSDCDGILEQAAPAFPVARPFETHQILTSGHALNLHYSAPETYCYINDFFNRTL